MSQPAPETNADKGRTLIHLLPRLRERENEAWTEFARLVAPVAHGVCCQSGLVEADADNVTQQLLVLAFVRLPTFEPDGRPKPLRPWVFGILYHLLQEHRHKRRAEPIDPTALELLPHGHVRGSERETGAPTVAAWLAQALAQVRVEFGECTVQAVELVLLCDKSAREAGE
ncbi:MAG TPA: hypothetical protein VFA18_22895, partial [Gemmataceae bacterium]|nr:hypothetical protein [Gemmataceae bacterium]